MLLAAAILLPQLVSAPPKDAVRIPTPGVEYRTNVASATRKPWINASGWRIDREPGKQFFYEAPGSAAALAAAESFAHDCAASILTDAAGSEAFAKMLAFLKSLPPGPAKTLADLGALDDLKAPTGEVLNLMARQNFQIRYLSNPDPSIPVIVDPRGKLPTIMAFLQEVREKVPDKVRVVRLFGGDTVLARVTSDGQRARVHLINYGTKPVEALRVRIAGHFERGEAVGYKLEDYDAGKDATEFSLPSIAIYAVVDLFPK
jgi:hypothetical protein